MHHHNMYSPLLRGVGGLRRHPRASRRAFYARSCKWTSEHSPSTHSGE